MKTGINPLYVVKTLVMAYLLICVSACSLQRVFMYYPATGIQPPEAYGLSRFADVRLQDKDGTHVHAWYAQAHPGYSTFLFFHGNGGNNADRAEYFRALTDAGFGLLALDYRGYGASDGSPSEEGFYEDARAAIEYATRTLHLPPNQIVLYGESIGTGVAVQMATEFPAAAIVLQSPYTSIEALGKERFSWLPVHSLIVDKFDSLSKIASVHAPLLLFHGENDNIIPVEQGKILFAKANEPKEAVFFSLQGHNDLNVGERVKALLAFGHKYRLIKG